MDHPSYTCPECIDGQMSNGVTLMEPSRSAGSEFRVCLVWQAWVRFVHSKRPSDRLLVGLLCVWSVLLLSSYRALILRYQYKEILIRRAEQHLVASEWNHRRLFFCVSPGRAGSKYLSAVLGSAKDIVSFHEPTPKMNNDVLLDIIIYGRRSETFQGRSRLKTNAIQNTLLGTASDVAYAETSHMFIKTFADVVLQRLAPVVANITIFVLHRNLKNVILSQLRLGWFGQNHSGWNVWYYDVSDVHPSEVVLSSSDSVSSSARFEIPTNRQLEKLVRYNDDIVARAHSLESHVGEAKRRGELTNVHIVHVDVESLNSKDPASIEQFLKNVGLKADVDRLALLTARDVNSRAAKKISSTELASEETVRKQIEEMTSLSQYLGCDNGSRISRVIEHQCPFQR